MIEFKADFNKIPFENKMNNSQKAVNVGLKKGIAEMSRKLTKRIKDDKLNGQVLKVKTGKLRNSIKSAITQQGDKITAEVSANTVYAQIHELGGSISVKGQMRKIKKRSYLATALEEMATKIEIGIANAIQEEISKA